MEPDRPASAPEAEPNRPRLDDGWAPGGHIPLDGPLEQRSIRTALFEVMTGVVVLGAAFVFFQLVVTPALLLAQVALAEGGMPSLQTIGDPTQVLGTYTRELILSNSGGQLLGLALPAFLMARLHTSRSLAFLRVRAVDSRLLVLAVVGVVGLQPVVQWLVQVNRMLPLPEAVRLFEQTQMELIRSVLESGLGVPFNLVMMAVVPGLCEEVLFRGYAQRQFERGAGPVGGILLSGLLFGAYHLRPTQILPLAGLGLYMAYLTWRTGSLWPAILVHTAHNGLAVLLSAYVRTNPDYDLQTLEQAPMPWYAVVGGFVIVGSVLYILDSLTRRLREA